MSEYGLGALPSPPDDRDWPLQLAPLTAPLPRRFVCAGMGPVLDQHKRPTCVAHAASGLATWFGKRDAEGVTDYDEEWLYARCKVIDGIPGDGTDGRSAMRVMKGTGLKAVNRPEPPEHFKIAAYYAVPVIADTLRLALTQYGPIVVGGAWYNSWFRPVNGVLPAAGGGVAGGHAVLLFGYDLDVGGGSFLIRNSWGTDWPGSVNGNAYVAFSRYVPSLWEAWKAVDVVTKP
jgi:hypothetical protein